MISYFLNFDFDFHFESFKAISVAFTTLLSPLDSFPSFPVIYFFAFLVVELFPQCSYLSF